MNDKAATLEQRAIVEALAHLNGMGYDRARAMLAEVERAAAEKAWDDCGKQLQQIWGRSELKADALETNPHRKETP